MTPLHRGHLPAFVRRWLEARTPPANPYPAAPHPIHDPIGFGEDAAYRVLKADLERSQQRTAEDKAAQAETRRRAFGEDVALTGLTEILPEYETHRWGTAGREVGPHPDDMCLDCAARYRDLPMAIHNCDPSVSPRTDEATS